ncbi:hypothetical protein FB192DRAFT_1357453 [Mucor lusitanicus]|uniref:Mid2 domain-containing protein n=1 Tax=Mucor circinelloides f. lusitanicus TaxID=29924 RepID=A0A8H4F8Z6_MUCCL|nr:hypothetical protein FB192DRAFT_1357453 [Mucor lusitanicus]
MFFQLIYSCTCFLLLINTTVAFDLSKRQAVASRSCGNENNTISICSPTFDSIWMNDTDQEITWKWNNPTLLQYNTLDLYLLHQPTEGTYEVIKTWPGQERTKGVLVQHIDNSWYPSQISDNSPNVSWTMYFYIVGADYDIQTDLALIPTQHNFFPVPQIFTLIQISRNTTATTPSTTTMSSSPTSTPSSVAAVTSGSNNGNKKLPGWAIAVIVIASLLFIAAVAALIWAYKRYKKRSNTNRRSMMALGPNNAGGDDEKVLILTPTKNESHVAIAQNIASTGDISSIHSSTQQLWSPRSLSPRQDEASFTSEKPQLGLNSDAHQSSSILSSTDALMIADTFRQFMRKPEWNEELELQKQQQKQGAGGDGTEAGGDATTTTAATTTRSEEERKRLGDQLLERQLKKEGTQVQSIDKFNH